MKRKTPATEPSPAPLYHHLARVEDGQIETDLFQDRNGKITLTCRRIFGGGEETVRLEDLGQEAAVCTRFARALAESETDPRVIKELWEEFSPDP